jgi:hypothetical protein
MPSTSSSPAAYHRLLSLDFMRGFIMLSLALGDKEKTSRVMNALMQMKKIDMNVLQETYND